MWWIVLGNLVCGILGYIVGHVYGYQWGYRTRFRSFVAEEKKAWSIITEDKRKYSHENTGKWVPLNEAVRSYQEQEAERLKNKIKKIVKAYGGMNINDLTHKDNDITNKDNK